MQSISQYPEQFPKPSPYDREENGAVQAMELFFGIFAHEIRGELSGIVQCLRVIQSGMNVKQHLEAIDVIAHSTLDTLENMLTMVKAHAGELNIQPEKEVFQFRDWISTVIQPCEVVAAAQGVRISLALHPLLTDANIFTDRVKLGQILHNLLNNAIKFSYPQTCITLICCVDGMDLILQVINQGAGIPADKIGLLFKPFHQLGKGYVGTGLGLYIGQLYAQVLGGKITVQSEQNATTVFTVNIPDCIQRKVE